MTGASRRAGIARLLAARGADLFLSSWSAHDDEQPWGGDPGGVAVNTRATLLLVRAFAAQHDGREGGLGVLFTSGQHLGPMPDELPYVASKGALHQLASSLADHLSAAGITVNCVDPGPTDTGYLDREAIASTLERFPAGRWGSPEDAARLIAWLLSEGCPLDHRPGAQLGGRLSPMTA